MQLPLGVAAPPAGMSVSELARRAGLNRSTLHRIATGESAPSLASLRELALVHGLDLEVLTKPLADPAAAEAARYLLDSEYDVDDPRPEVLEWADRLIRYVGNAPIPLVTAAGAASSLLNRTTDVVFLRGKPDRLRVASAGDAAPGDWALSGAPHLALTGRDATGPVILWTENPAVAASLLLPSYREAASPLNATVILAKPTGAELHGGFEERLVRFVSPTQGIIDSIGLGGETSKLALEIAGEW